MAEFLDIVDENDQVVGTLPRAEIHRLGLRHRFVQALVVGTDGRVLLQRRGKHKGDGSMLLDASVGGHIDAGESYETAVKREGQEELGLNTTGHYMFLCKIEDVTPGIENMVGSLFLYHSDGPFTDWETEAERIFWVSKDELRTLLNTFPFLLTGGLKSSLKIFLAYLG